MKTLQRLTLGLALLLLATMTHAASVTLVWDYTQGADEAIGFNMYRCHGAHCKKFVLLNPDPLPIKTLTNADGTLFIKTPTYTDNKVRRGRTYRWYVRAVNTEGQSRRSNVFTYRVPNIPVAGRNVRRVAGE